jgi:GTP-binding protein EngB required for normal cell division
MDKFTALRLQINVAIVGCVSVGKSTLNNALFVEQLSDCHMKRTTAVPQLYHELTRRETLIAEGKVQAHQHDLSASDIENIRTVNRVRNAAAMASTLEGNALTLADIAAVEYIVPKIKAIFDLKGDSHGNDVVLTIHDLPGLNDAKTKSVYFEHIRSTRKEIDLYVFVTDITSGCNTSEEVEILELVGECVKANKADELESRVLVVVNKCDELVHKGNEPPYPVDDEQQEMLKQIQKVVGCAIPHHSLACVSAEDAFIYRMVMAKRFDDLDDKYIAKLGANEFGRRQWSKMDAGDRRKSVAKILDTVACNEGVRMSGFTNLAVVLRDIFTPQTQYVCLLNHYRNALEARELSPIALDISEDLQWFRTMDVRLCMLNKLFEKTERAHTNLYTDKLRAFMAAHLAHIDYVCKASGNTGSDSLLAAKKHLQTTEARLDLFCAGEVKSIITVLDNEMNGRLFRKLAESTTTFDGLYEALAQLKENDCDDFAEHAHKQVFEGVTVTSLQTRSEYTNKAEAAHTFITRVGDLAELSADTTLRARLSACDALVQCERDYAPGRDFRAISEDLAVMFATTHVDTDSPLYYDYTIMRAKYFYRLVACGSTEWKQARAPRARCPLVEAVTTGLRAQGHSK